MIVHQMFLLKDSHLDLTIQTRDLYHNQQEKRLNGRNPNLRHEFVVVMDHSQPSMNHSNKNILYRKIPILHLKHWPHIGQDRLLLFEHLRRRCLLTLIVKQSTTGSIDRLQASNRIKAKYLLEGFCSSH